MPIFFVKRIGAAFYGLFLLLRVHFLRSERCLHVLSGICFATLLLFSFTGRDEDRHLSGMLGSCIYHIYFVLLYQRIALWN